MGIDVERPQARKKKSSAPLASFSFNLWAERMAIPRDGGRINRLIYFNCGHRWWFVVPSSIAEIRCRN